MMAITRISKEIKMNEEFKDMKPMDGTRMLVLSLGTGAVQDKNGEKYNATKASKWGIFKWLYDNGNSPLLDVYSDASSDIVDICMSTVFEFFNHKDNYLRIQVPSYLECCNF